LTWSGFKQKEHGKKIAEEGVLFADSGLCFTGPSQYQVVGDTTVSMLMNCPNLQAILCCKTHEKFDYSESLRLKNGRGALMEYPASVMLTAPSS
jgi:hypothetical protein